MPWPSAATSRAGVQMQGFHPTICGLSISREGRGTARKDCTEVP